MTGAPFDPAEEAIRLRRRLERLAARPTWGKRKIFLRIAVPNLREVVREQWHTLEAVDDEALTELVESLWNGVTYDEMHLTVELLRLRGSLVSEELIDRLRAGLDNQAVTDDLAAVVRSWVAADPETRFEALERWSAERHAWSRRLALLGSVLLARRGTEVDRILEMVTTALDDRRQPVLTAVSTVLRELTKSEPDRVEAFVEQHSDDLAARVRIEVWNKLHFGRKDGTPSRRTRKSAGRAGRAEGSRTGRQRAGGGDRGTSRRSSRRRGREGPG
jgi:3-methyladenine DNA glycosylase AlkD